jgi:hypothetical protein
MRLRRVGATSHDEPAATHDAQPQLTFFAFSSASARLVRRGVHLS